MAVCRLAVASVANRSNMIGYASKKGLTGALEGLLAELQMDSDSSQWQEALAGVKTCVHTLGGDVANPRLPAFSSRTALQLDPSQCAASSGVSTGTSTGHGPRGAAERAAAAPQGGARTERLQTSSAGSSDDQETIAHKASGGPLDSVSAGTRTGTVNL